MGSNESPGFTKPELGCFVRTCPPGQATFRLVPGSLRAPNEKASRYGRIFPTREPAAGDFALIAANFKIGTYKKELRVTLPAARYPHPPQHTHTHTRHIFHKMQPGSVSPSPPAPPGGRGPGKGQALGQGSIAGVTVGAAHCMGFGGHRYSPCLGPVGTALRDTLGEVPAHPGTWVTLAAAQEGS